MNKALIIVLAMKSVLMTGTAFIVIANQDIKEIPQQNCVEVCNRVLIYLCLEKFSFIDTLHSRVLYSMHGTWYCMLSILEQHTLFICLLYDWSFLYVFYIFC